MKMVLGVGADPRYLDPDLALVITNKYREPNIDKNCRISVGVGYKASRYKGHSLAKLIISST